jgi:hypothetical protein
MPVNLFGNINGTYQPPQMNLLGLLMCDKEVIEV